MPLAVGDIFKGALQVEEIKQGGMGTIYICRYLSEKELRDNGVLYEEKDFVDKNDTSPQRNGVALKTVSSDFFQSGEDNAMRFNREGIIWTTLPPHPYIIECTLVDALDSAPLIWLEYAEGGSLRDRLLKRPLSLVEALKLFRQFCVGMQFLYDSRGIIHRDIKPENILFTNDNQVKITDFGLSSLREYSLKVLLNVHEENSSLSFKKTFNFIGGTLPYMSPEHFGVSDITIKSDVYSFGAVMFEVLEGRLLFNGASVEDFQKAHLAKLPPKISSHEVPPEISSIVAKCLEKKPECRFTDFAELEEAIVKVITHKHLELTAPERPSFNDLEKNIGAKGWNRRGYSFGRLSLFDESLRCYKRALEMSPETIGVHGNVGTALERVGRYNDALAYFEKEVELNGEIALTRAQLALAYANRGRWDDALYHLEIAANMPPPSLPVMRELCILYRKFDRESDFDKVVSKIEKEMVSNPELYLAAGWVNEGLHFGLMGELKTSLYFFDECIRRFPENTDGWYNRAVTQLFMRDFVGATDSIKNVLEYEPNLIQAHFLLGIIYFFQSDIVNSVMEWQKTIVLDQNHRLSLMAEKLISLASTVPSELAIDFLLSTIPISNIYYR